jgi:hypothetical protein
VYNVKKGNSQPLTDALLKLELNALKDVLTNRMNDILDLLMEDETSKYLAWMFSVLVLDNLNAVLRADSDKILNLLMEKEFSKHLTWVLFNVKPTDLKKILENRILNPQHLAAALTWLKLDALSEVLINPENGILNLLVAEAREETHKLLVDMLLRLKPDALKDVFIDGANRILDLLVEDEISEDLVWCSLPSGLIT